MLQRKRVYGDFSELLRHV